MKYSVIKYNSSFKRQRENIIVDYGELAIEEIEKLARNEFFNDIFHNSHDEVVKDLEYIKEVGSELWSPTGLDEWTEIKEVNNLPAN